MNPRPGFLAMLFLLLVASSGAYAQGVIEYVVVKNESISFEVQSRFEPVLGQAPSDGNIEIVEDPVFNYTITYTPDNEFVGDDGLLLVTFPFDQSIAFQNYVFKVREAFMKANHDFAATPAGEAITIAPLMNDSTNIGSMALTGVPITNAGTAEVVGDEIVFTPAPGFSGLTDLNYTVCTVSNTCALGTISVNVLPTAETVAVDTVRVFTTLDKAQFIFAPENAEPLSSPQSGTMVSQDGVMAYQPHEGFVGDEYLEYGLPGSDNATVYHITVLDLKPNDFAVDDREFTPSNTPRTFNVLYNDLYSVFADCVVYGAPQYGTLVEDVPNGQVTYTPPANWTGVDQFTYSSKTFNCEGEAELATVYIFVSNFNPADTETQLTAPEGSTLDLTYDVPGGNATWSVIDQPAHGVVVTDPLTGKLNYLPGVGSAGETDEFTLSYCLNEDTGGNCQFSTEVEVSVTITPADPNACVDEDCVWPGDTNNDGVVDVGDLLPIGLAMGQTGVPRLEGSESWSPQYGLDWTQDDLNGVNLKHVDADGDQIITAADTAVVMANMGLAHGLRPQVQNFSTFQLSLVGPTVAEPGDLVVLDLIAGANTVIVEDIYGIRWPFVYDPQVVDPGGVEIVYGEDSWASYDSPILGLSSNDTQRGVLESAMTRTNGEGIAGYGKIATVSAVIVEDIYGIREESGTAEANEGMTVTLGGGDGATVMNSVGHVDAVTVNPFNLTITPKPATEVIDFTPADAVTYLDGKLLAYPNPTAASLTVHLNGQQRFSALQLTDITGRVLLSEQGLETNHRELNLSQMPNGIYTLTITTEAGVVNRKIEVLR